MLFLRAAPILLVVLAIIYVCAFYYLRDTYRDRLETGGDGVEPAFIDARVNTYVERMRKQLALYVFGVPLGLIAMAIFIVDLL